MAGKKKSSPLAVHEDGRKYVAVDAIMNPVCALIDGLPVTFFGKSGRAYLLLADAICWVECEMTHHSRAKYERILAALRRFESEVN